MFSSDHDERHSHATTGVPAVGGTPCWVMVSASMVKGTRVRNRAERGIAY